jgi:peptide/nickel transport system permease protein
MTPDADALPPELEASAGAGGAPVRLTIPGGGLLRPTSQLGSRLAQMLLTALAGSLIAFTALYFAPGDPLAVITGGTPTSSRAAAQLRAEYYLNHPFLAQYWHWLSGVLSGHFGTSFLYHVSVGSLLTGRLPTTLLLVAMAGVLIIGLGLTMGVLSAFAGRRSNVFINTLYAVSIATPTYVVAIVLITIFSLYLNWFPVFGSGSGLTDRLHHLVLPAVTLALGSGGALARVTRASVLEEASREHTITAVARGMTPLQVLRRHVVRNALLPVTTGGGLIVAALVGGDVIVEQAYGLNGLGSLLVLAIDRKDYPVVLGVLIVIVAAFLLINALIDLLYVLIDPRTRARGA